RIINGLVNNIQNKYKYRAFRNCLFFLPIVILFFISWKTPTASSEKPTKAQWVDSVMNTMDLEEKIGQLFMVAAYSNKNDKHIQELESLIKKHKIGGLIFFQGGPVRQATLTNRYQS